MTLFDVEKLTYYYPDAPKPALDCVSLSIREGDFLLLTGPSGGGKTTLARALSGLVPSLFGGRIGGRVRYRERDLATLDRRTLHTEIGMVLQDPERQILMTSVARELALGPENLGFPPDVIRRRVMEIAASLGIAGHLGSRTDELSCGLLQRVAVGAILAMGPRALILDEPTSQLDPVASEELLELLKRFHDDLGYTILLIEQRIESCLAAAERVLFLQGGRVDFDGPPRGFCQWAQRAAPHFLPPVSRLLSSDGHASPPLTVREGRAILRSRTLSPHSAPPPVRETSGQLHAEKNEPVASLDNVEFAYENTIPALRGIRLAVRRGEILSVIGPNGAGKSTLLKTICGLLLPSRGAIRVMGQDPSTCTNQQRAMTFGYVPQNPSDFLFNESVFDEVGYTLRAIGRYSEEIVRESLARWGITHLSARNPRELSAGERQCVMLAAATIAGPALLLLDEPTRGQDPQIKERLGGQLASLSRDHHTAIIVVTQDIEFAAEWSHRIALLSDGEVIADGPKNAVFDGGPFYSPQLSRLFHGIAEGIVTFADAREALRTKED